MPEITVDIEIWCSCGAGLCNQSSLHRTGRGFVVEPCENCLENARNEGFNEGYDKGYEEGGANANQKSE